MRMKAYRPLVIACILSYMTASDRLGMLHERTFTSAEAIAAGLSWRDLYRLRDTGIIMELSRGVWRAEDAAPTAHEDLLAVACRAPNGVFCLDTALAWWDLADHIPAEVHLAVAAGATRPRIKMPPTRVHVFDASSFGLGQCDIEAASHEWVPMTNPERTVVDAIRFRHRIGTGISSEALRRYLQRPKAQPGELLRYARLLNVNGPVTRLLEALT